MKCTENEEKGPKRVHCGEAMYKIQKREAEFPATDLAFGGKLRKDNRWVQLAELIPWDYIEEKYASRMSTKNGRKAYSVRVALGACIIKEKLGISDEETVELIRENHYLQYFIGYESYRDERPFDPSMMVHFRKRLTAEILKELNDLIIETEIKKQKEQEEKPEDDEEPPAGGSGTQGNEGTLIVDATCAPEAMRYPHDVTTLDECRRKTERIIDILQEGMPRGIPKPRTYRKKARKLFLRFIRNRKPRTREIRRALKQQIQFVERNLRSIKEMSETIGLGALSKKQYKDLEVIKEYVAQQRALYKTGHLEGRERILSISKPYVRPIARGKARGMYEFGSKISISMFQGFTRVERVSWNNYNEGNDLIDQIELHRVRYGRYPAVVCADKIYRTRANLEYCKERGIRLSGPKLGRPYKDESTHQEQKTIERADERVRVVIEGKIGEAKTRYTLDRIERRLQETSESAIMMVFLLANLVRIMRSRMRDIFSLIWEMFSNWFSILFEIPYQPKNVVKLV